MMNVRFRNLLLAAGSVMELSSARDLRLLARRRTGAERMAAHFARVGESLGRACGNYATDAKPSRPKA